MPLADIVALGNVTLDEILSADNPYEKANWFFAKRIESIELSKLGEFLGVGSYDEIMVGFQLVGEPIDEGPWPMTFPSTLSARIRQLTDAQAESVSVTWAEIEEFRGRAPVASLREYLINLRDFMNAHDGPFILMLAL